MPCVVDLTPQEIQQMEEARDAQVIAEHAEQFYDPLLCSACRALERMGYDFDENPLLSEWWARHQKEDAEKKRAELRAQQKQAVMEAAIEELTKKPISELTKAEKKFLREQGVF